MSSTEETYVRVMISGVITTLSPAHFGSSELTERPDNEQADESIETQIPCIDHNGNPYIPASTIRGHLREKYKHYTGKNKEKLTRIFGAEEMDPNAPYQSGRIRIRDGLLASDQKIDYRKQMQVAINSITGTAADQQLFATQWIPEGTQFHLSLEADHVTAAEAYELQLLLNTLDGSENSLLGKGRTLHAGKVAWEEKEAKKLTVQSLKEWLTGPTLQEINASYTDLTKTPNEKLNTNKREVQILKLFPQGPILINGLTEKPKDNEPKQSYQKTKDGNLLLPASSLKGLLRAHCSKILKTMAISLDQISAKSAAEIANEMVTDIFGNEGQRAAIWVGNALSDEPVAIQDESTLGKPLTKSTPKEHSQFFNAIDRFTGAATDGKLYRVTAAIANSLTCSISYDKQWLAQHPWVQGLAILVLRDAMEGDLSIGWGKSKGYGNFTVALPELNNKAQQGLNTADNQADFASLLEHHQASFESKVTQLETELLNRLNKEHSK